MPNAESLKILPCRRVHWPRRTKVQGGQRPSQSCRKSVVLSAVSLMTEHWRHCAPVALPSRCLFTFCGPAAVYAIALGGWVVWVPSLFRRSPFDSLYPTFAAFDSGFQPGGMTGLARYGDILAHLLRSQRSDF
jgi:hypothetical protein